MVNQCRAAALLLAFVGGSCVRAQNQFALHNGDRVVWYGDSITDNSPYCVDVEAYTVLHFPNLNVRFFNAGMSGDQVRGGGLGPVDQRLTRDLFSRNPTIVTSMLGMNDAHYAEFAQTTLDAYQTGYQHILDRIKKEAPAARVWLFRPSPYDEVTRTSHPNGMSNSYNAVLLRFSDSVTSMAQQNGYNVLDQNQPMVDVLTRANSIDPENAKKIIRDQVHPGWQGDLVMAEQVIKAWNGPGIVSTVFVDVQANNATTQNSKVSGLTATATSAQWTETDASLPFPIERKDQLAKLILQSSDFDQSVNQETLTVRGLAAGNYRLTIDGKDMGVSNADQFSAGINLAALPTPMLAQAAKVMDITRKRSDLFYQRWRQLDVDLQDYPSSALETAKRSIDGLVEELVAEQHSAAQPKAHMYVIAPA